MRKLFEFVRRVFQTALTHKHEFVIAVLTFASDHRLVVCAGFAALLGVWFVISAVFDIRHPFRKRKRTGSRWRMLWNALYLRACLPG